MQTRIVQATVTSIVIALSACGAEPITAEDQIAAEQFEVVSGSVEPNYRYPWVVRLNGCHGVLIDPSWVLTAAHCVAGTWGNKVRWSRTDPYSGVTYAKERTASSSNVHMHPNYQQPGQFSNDIALIKLSSPFVLDKYIQTAGVPKTPKTGGTIARLASFSHNLTLGTGQAAVFRAPLPSASLNPTQFDINSDDTNNAALCQGDSGSGLVTVEGGRALVRGIAGNSTVTDCQTPFGVANFADVYGHRNWILTTMSKTAATLAGNTRVRWSGRTSRGVMGLGCTNPFGTMWGPLNVVGVQEGANCAAGDTQAIVCSLGSSQPYKITSFKLKTIYANGSSSTQALPHSDRWASHFSVTPSGVTREFTCSVGWTFQRVKIFANTMLAK